MIIEAIFQLKLSSYGKIKINVILGGDLRWTLLLNWGKISKICGKQ